MAALNRQRQGGHSYRNGQQRQSNNQNSPIHVELWLLLINQSVPRSEIYKKPTAFLLNLYKQKISKSNGQKTNLNCKNKESSPFNQFPNLSQFTDPEPLEWRGAWIPLRKDPTTLPTIYAVTLFPIFPQKISSLLPGYLCTGEREMIRHSGNYWTLALSWCWF